MLKNAKSTSNQEDLKEELWDNWKEKHRPVDVRNWFKVTGSIVGVILFLVAPLILLFLNINNRLVNSIFIALAVFVISMIFLVRAVYKTKHISYSKKQLKQLADAEELDKKNEKLNAEAIAKGKIEHKEKQTKYISECKKDIEKIVLTIEKDNDELKKVKDKILKNDCIADQEKVLEIVDMLVYFIETKRADSIKESLHEYDKIRYNEAQLMIEQQKLALQQQKIEQERIDRQEKMEQDRRHQDEIESQMRQDAQDREQIARDVRYAAYWKK